MQTHTIRANRIHTEKKDVREIEPFINLVYLLTLCLPYSLLLVRDDFQHLPLLLQDLRRRLRERGLVLLQGHARPNGAPHAPTAHGAARRAVRGVELEVGVRAVAQLGILKGKVKEYSHAFYCI